mgnify:CR=1 FL=1
MVDPGVPLEASGGVTLDTVGALARTESRGAVRRRAIWPARTTSHSSTAAEMAMKAMRAAVTGGSSAFALLAVDLARRQAARRRRPVPQRLPITLAL